MSSNASSERTVGIPVLDKIDSILNKTEKYFATYMFIIMLALMVIQVLFRYFLMIGIPWVEELIRFMFVATSFVAAAYLSSNRDHIVIDVINVPILSISDPKKRENTNRFFWLVADFISLTIAVLVTYRCHIFTMGMYNTSQSSPSMEAPMYIVVSFMELGFILMVVHYLIKIINGLFTKPAAKEGGKA